MHAWLENAVCPRRRGFNCNGSDLPESGTALMRQGCIWAGAAKNWFTGQDMRSVQDVTALTRWVSEA